MYLTRRSLINSATTGATGRLFLASTRVARYRAVALDAFTILDPRPIAARAEEVFPGKGPLLTDLWRTRQFEYTWLRTITRTYVDFRQITEDSLVYAANALALDLSTEKKHRLLQCFWEFKPWPDALAALATAQGGRYPAGLAFELHCGDADVGGAQLRIAGSVRAAPQYRQGACI